MHTVRRSTARLAILLATALTGAACEGGYTTRDAIYDPCDMNPSWADSLSWRWLPGLCPDYYGMAETIEDFSGSYCFGAEYLDHNGDTNLYYAKFRGEAEYIEDTPKWVGVKCVRGECEYLTDYPSEDMLIPDVYKIVSAQASYSVGYREYIVVGENCPDLSDNGPCAYETRSGKLFYGTDLEFLYEENSTSPLIPCEQLLDDKYVEGLANL